MKKRLTISMLTLVVSLTMAAQGLTQDGEGYYLIGSVDDWKAFATLVQTTPTAKAKMTTDINLGDDQTMIGTDIYYQGTFDGQGHKLTVAYSVTDNTSQHVAPFIKIKNATIQNLHISGSITTAGMRPASITSYVSGTCYVRNCWSEVAITSSHNADICAGGLVTRIDANQTLNMEDCKFSGSITLSTNGGYAAGGLIGWTQDKGIANVKNCLVAPSALSTITTSNDNKVLVSGYQNKVTITNCYYNEVGASSNWVVQGTAATNAEQSDGTIAYKLQADREDLVWGLRIGTNPEPILTSDDSYRVYRRISGGCTNNPDEAYLGLQQDADGNYLVGLVWDWKDFVELIKSIPTANAKMTADINLGDDQTVATSNFKGIFDGQGHTMTVNLTSTKNYYGLFCGILGATIKNLHVKGMITTSHRFTGGIVGESSGTSNIINCWSSVTLNSSYSGDAVRGGLVGDCNSNSTLNFNDCLFDGVFEGENSYTWGGLVGWTYGNTSININNCLFAPAGVNINVKSFATFSGNGGTVTNSYYTQTWNNSTQGTAATAEEFASGYVAYRLQDFRSEYIWGQRIGTGDADAYPILTSDADYHVYRSKTSGYTNVASDGYPGMQKADDGYYLLSSVSDWIDFVTLEQAVPTINARLTADIDLGDDQTVAASSTCRYRGTFDGQGHTITYNLTTTDNSYGLFREVSGATIQNLHVAGTINSSHCDVGGIVGYIYGRTTISNCWSSVTINSSREGRASIGGLVGSVKSLTYINDCLFDGVFEGAKATYWGGFIGYDNSSAGTPGSIHINNSLFAPTSVHVKDLDPTSGNGGYVTNTYVTMDPNKAKKATLVTEEQIRSGYVAYRLQAFRENLVWGQQIGTDDKPALTSSESYRVYRHENGTDYTNNLNQAHLLQKDAADGYYLIGSVIDWQELAAMVVTMPATNAKMTADIDLGDDQTVIPCSYNYYGTNEFQGIFDGQGHTLTVNLTATGNCYGPFHALNSGTIKNLHVTGTITTSYMYVGGIVGSSMRSGTNRLTNCWSSVTMKSTKSGEYHIGGFVGETDDYDTLIMTDCLFDGSFEGPNTSEWGGFVGLNYYSTVKISNSLFAPASVNIKGGLCTFSNNWGGSTQTNCFTSVSGNTTQGVLVTEEQLTSGSVAYLLQKGRNDLIWAQKIGNEIENDTHPLLFSDNSSRVYSKAGGGYTNDPAQEGSDLVFDFTIADNGNITIKGFRSDFTPPSDYALDIPDEIGGYPVIAIGEYAFKQKSTITSLNIGRNVQSIGRYAFQECTGLQSVEIPNTVTSFGERVFTGCTSMASVTFEEGCKLTSFPSETFNNCSSLTEIVIPSSVTSISGWVFYNCTNLKSLTIPENVKSLDDGIWYGCANMTSLDLSKATQIAALYTMTSINRNSGIFRGLSANCEVILPYGCQATGNHVTIAEPDENSIGIADDGYYELSKPEHWKTFVAIAQAVPTANARLTADIDLGDEQTVATSNNFKGIFDGQCHTMTINLTSTKDYYGLFCGINGATIKNLHVTGTITTSHRFTGGIVGESSGTSNIINCWSSVTLNSLYSGDAVRGGLVGDCKSSSTLNISDCIFDGVFEGAKSYTWGGLVGWRYGSVNISNCLFNPASVNIKVDYFSTFSGNGGTVTDSYYTQTWNNSTQGALATAKQLAEGSIACKLQADRANLFWGQRIDSDSKPVLTSDESYRVYKSKNGGYTNDPTLVYEGLQQDADGNYLIGSLADWQEFASIVDATPTANGKMTADIDLGDDQTVVAEYNCHFKGIFDGQCHTMTVNLTSTRTGYGLFGFVEGATIKNLHVTGTINTSYGVIGGIVGVSNGTSNIINCWSSVTMNSSYDGLANLGGLVGQCQSGTLNICDCLFDGVFDGENSYSWGGMVGWRMDESIVNINNCLFAPVTLNIGITIFDTFSCNGGTVTNSYYTQTKKDQCQGKKAIPDELADGSIAYKLQADRANLFWGQRIDTDSKPMLTSDESYRVYKSKNGGYTNDPTLVYEGFQQDADGNYLIGSLADWQEFAGIVDTTPTANGKMTADIDLGDDQTTIGTNNIYYQGTFDGQGHTLKVNLTTTQDGYGPFLTLNGATIKNLHVTGTITNDSYPSFGGIAGYIGGPSTLTNCRSSVTLKNTSGDNGSLIGGIVAGTSTTDNSITALNMSDCLFDGKFEGTNNSNSNWSGLVGWIYNTTVEISNSLFAPASVDINGKLYTIYGKTWTFNESGSTLVHLYTTMAGSSSTYTQGTVATTEELADGTTTANLQNSRSEVFWVQDPVTNKPMLAIFATVTLADGDASGDGKVDEKDMIFIIQYLLGESPEGFDTNAADLNGDKKVTITDLLLLMEKLEK